MPKKKPLLKKPARRKSTDETRDLLLEIGTEELPPKDLQILSESLGREFYTALRDAGLVAEENGDYQIFATPRRLAVRVKQVRSRQADRTVERRGPAIQAAFDAAGKPTRAAEGFARSCGTKVDCLKQQDNDKGSWLIFESREKGKPAASLIPEILEEVIRKLPIAKRMRWGDLEAEFVRPVHWLLLLHGSQVIKCDLLSVKAGNQTRGHRFMAPKPVRLKSTGDYERVLKQQFVITDFGQRKEKIRSAVQRLAKQQGGQALIDEALLDEVTSLVEWPEPILGEFDKAFLDLPGEVLVSTMQDNQKYFPVTGKQKKLKPNFITVSNIRSRRKVSVRSGNERVLRARFADARFFWENDRKSSLASRVEQLRTVVFHDKLGTIYDKIERCKQVAIIIATELDGDRTQIERAVTLSKADLVTGMVAEFPELQGTMGRYYALHDGEADNVATAIEEHYLPRYAGDRIAATTAGQAIAIADKLDTLVGIFGVGEEPSGDKDPFALRRAAVGVLRTAIEGELDINLKTLLRTSVVSFSQQFDAEKVSARVYDFMLERLRAYYGEIGISADVFETVRACRPERPYDFDKRVRAVMAFRKLKEAESLTAANKRIRNILKQGGTANWNHVSKELLSEPTEIRLDEKIDELKQRLAPLFDRGDYTAAMKQLAKLRSEVDNFFDNVMVMVDEEAVRDNRLALLSGLSDLFLRVADLSKLQG